jgi:hypothetical protein
MPKTALGQQSTVVDDFMLKEYESIAAAHFDCQVGIRQHTRFYLALMAVPLTILGLAFKDRPANEIAGLNLLHVPRFLDYTFMAVGGLGILMLLAMIHTGLDSLLYARTVNGIRAFFSDRGAELGTDLSPYFLMPTDKNKPKYFHVRGFFWLVVLVSAANTTYIAFPAFLLWGGSLCHILFTLLVFLVQLGIYRVFCWMRQHKEVAG